MPQYQIDILLTSESLDIANVQTWANMGGVGGTCLFVGTVRDTTQGKTVQALDFEAFEPMAKGEMRRIAETACKRWPVQKVAIHHRIGRLEIGDIPVIIAVSAAHRDAAFAACRYCIDTLKQKVPIWKKEIFEDGEVWVAAHP